MIRPATLTDVPRIVAMGHRFITTTGYRGRFPTNHGPMRRFVERLLESGREHAMVDVSEHAGVLTGMIGAFRYVHPMSDEIVASEAFWWVEPEHRGQGIRLLRKAEAWATAVGAVRLQMIAPTEQVGRVYARLGFTLTETLYERTLAE